MKKRSRRLIAMLLAASMILQQSSLGAMASETELATEAATEVAVESETAAPEGTEQATEPVTEAKGTETSAPETTEIVTEAATQVETETTAATETETTVPESTEAPAETETTAETETPAATEAAGETDAAPVETEATEAATEAAEAQTTEAEEETEEEPNFGLMTMDLDSPVGIVDTVSDLTGLVSSAELSGMNYNSETQAYTAAEGQPYNITIYFKETRDAQFDDRGVMHYKLPANLKPVGSFPITDTFDITISEKVVNSDGTTTDISYVVSGNSYTIDSDGNVTVTFNQNDTDFAKLAAASNAEFGLRLSASFSGAGKKEHLDFGDSVTKEVEIVEPVNKVEVDKQGWYDNKTGKMCYKLTIKSTGYNENVVVKDQHSGELFTMPDALDSAKTSMPYGTDVKDGTYVKTSDGFTYTIQDMLPGEEIWLEYSADVNFDLLESGATITESERTNSVIVTSKQDPEGDDAEHVQNEISYKDNLVSKSDSSYDETKKIIPWSFSVNSDHHSKIGGKPITDTIAEDSRKYLTYNTPISVSVTKLDGSVEVRTLDWNSPGMEVQRGEDNSVFSWTYTPPEEDGRASYVFTYSTNVNVSGQVEDLTLSNSAEVEGKTETGKAVIGAKEEDKAKLTKYVSSTTDTSITWGITIEVPAGGFDSCVVKDTLPTASMQIGEQWKTLYDILDKTSIKIATLLDGETYEPTYTYVEGSDTVKEFAITFYKGKDENGNLIPGLKGTGSKREVTITFVTKYDEEWLASENKEHKNNVKMYANDVEFTSSATHTITEKKITKSVVQKEVTTQYYPEVITIPYFEYTLLISGVASKSDYVIEDKFDKSLLKYFEYNGIQVRGGSSPENMANEVGTASWEDTTEGGKITITKLPMNGINYYPYYKITYCLTPVDEAALAKLSGGETVTNTAKWSGVEGSVSTTFEYKPLKKSISSWANKENNYKAGFKIEVNENKATLNGGNDLTVTDTLTNLRFVQGSLKITADDEQLTDIHYTYTNNVLQIQIPDGKYVVITYDAYVTGKSGEKVSYSNSAVVTGDSKGSAVSGEATLDTSGGGLGSILSIFIVKHEKGDYTKTLSGVCFRLEEQTKNGDFIPVVDKSGKQATFTTDSKGRATITGNQDIDGWTLYENTVYRLVEEAPLTGYEALEEPIVFTVTKYPTEVGQYGNGETIYIANTKIEDETVSKSVEKVWADNGDQDGLRPNKIKVQLKADNVDFGEPVELDAEHDWKHTWTDLPKKANGTDITYTVEEVDTVAGYTNETKTDASGKVIITNSHKVGTVGKSVEKVWEDDNNRDGLRPDNIKVQLKADNVNYGDPVELSAEENWKHTWTDLPKEADGKDITYTVDEIGTVSGYTKEVKTDATGKVTITNKHEIATTTKSVEKVWVDGNDKDNLRPDKITVQLKADNVDFGEPVELDAEHGWKYTWTDLPKKANGTDITYTVEEVDTVAGYTKETKTDASGNVVITNTHVLYGSITLGAKKVFDRTFKGDEFSFLLQELDAQGKVKEGGISLTAKNDENGNVAFDEITYTEPNKYYYQITEVVPTEGRDATIVYDETVKKVTVTVEEKDGALTASADVQAEDVVFTNKTTNVKVDKVDDAGRKLADAKLQITLKNAGNGDVVDSWTTDGNVHDITGKLEVGKTYVLEETEVPTGYAISKPIEFTLDAEGNLVSGGQKLAGNLLTMTDAKLKFNVNKTEFGTGNEVEGAELEVLDKDNNVVESWTSKKGETHDFGGKLKAGETYTLREKVAPDGYAYVTDITFTVETDGTIKTDMPKTTDTKTGETTYLVEDAKIRLNVDKRATGTGDEVEGAVLELLDKDGKVVESWTSKKGETHDFGGKLKAGETYTLRETVTPDGYLVAADITFTVGKDGSVQTTAKTSKDAAGNTVYLMEDDLRPETANGSIAVTKSMIDPDGNALGADNVTFFVALFADAAKTKRVSGVKAITFNGTTATTATFDKLAKGTYYVGETDVDGKPLDMNIGQMRGETFEAVFPDGDSVVLESDSFAGQLHFNNQFYGIPVGFYYDGELWITKKVMLGSEPMESTDTFYAGVFEDEACTKLYALVELEMNGTDTSEPQIVRIPKIGEKPTDGKTFYVRETDETGTPLDEEAIEFQVNVDRTEVTVTGADPIQKVTITNTFEEEEETESESETEEEETETETEKAAPRTGDDTNSWMYLFLMAMSAGVLLIAAGQKRREEKETGRTR